LNWRNRRTAAVVESRDNEPTRGQAGLTLPPWQLPGYHPARNHRSKPPTQSEGALCPVLQT
jgi:hypothetical protein